MSTPRADAVASLSPADWDRVTKEWNATGAEFPDACTHELFERQVAANPAAIAVSAGEERLSYGDLNARANRLAHHLRRHGVGPDSLVGVSLHRTPLMVVGLLGVWKAGGAYVPLDPTYPPDRLQFMLEDSGARVLITDATSTRLFPNAAGTAICLETDWPAIEAESAENPRAGATPANLAYVIYTSGSTGKPKGALIEHRGLVNYLWWAMRFYGAEAGGCAPVHSSISFDLTVTSLYPALLSGGEVELVPEDAGAQSLIANLRRAKNRSVVKITPAHLEILTQQVSADEARSMTRCFVIGGENLTAESLRFWREAAPATRLINEYGPTETVVGCCVYEMQPADPHNGSVPIGRPIANTELYVLDESLEPVAIGSMGELYIGGAGVARGYLNREELSRERFLPDTFSGRAGGRLYKTGDLARYRADGILEYLGRVDSQVKIRGYRIELGEIEATLAGHGEVQSCAVLAREDVPGNRQLVGYVVPNRGATPKAEEIRRYLLERLPDYMVPGHCVILESFPLTNNGKIDRRALPAPTYADAAVTQAFVAPRSDTEQALAKIWTELLTLDRVGIHDDVFELGATSLMVLGAVARIRSTLGKDVEMQVLFEHPTIAQMAKEITGADAGEAPAAGQLPAVAAPQSASVSASPGHAASAPADSHLLPIRFGAPGREMLGLYQWPSTELDRRECCLLLNPFGQEAMRSHRIYRIIADRLSRGGFHVLRFDYYATGDSLGEDEEADLDQWLEDVGRANEELLRRSGASASAWFGLRLGGSLAALASARAARPPKRLVLWDPIADGADYLAELTRAHVAARSAPFELRWDIDAGLRAAVNDEARREALGYPVTTTLKEQLRRLGPAAFSGARAERVTLLSAAPRADLPAIEQALRSAGRAVQREELKTAIEWTVNEMLSDSIVVPDDMRRIATALTGEP